MADKVSCKCCESSNHSIRKRVYEIIEKAKDGDKASAIFDSFLIILILLNVAAVICNSFDNLNNSYNKFFTIFEYISVSIFTIEYLLRIWTAPEKYPPEPIKELLFL